MFKIVKKSAWNEMAHEVVTLREANARLVNDIPLVEKANASLLDRLSKAEDFMSAQRTKINACADTKKYLRGKIEEQTAEIKKLKEQLADAKYQLRLANKLDMTPKAEQAPPAEQQAEPTPAPAAKKPYKKRTPKAGK